MAVSNYFDNFSFFGEQSLLKDLGEEMIKQRGLDIYYMPRSHVNIDALWLEDTLSQFTQATVIEVYIKNFMGYQGEGDMFSKFGLSMADQLTLCMMRSRWDEEFTRFQPTLIRPLEGDFIYVAMTNALFEVKFVEHEANFYSSGQLTYYEIRCERVNYSSENISTGVPAIDNIQSKFSMDNVIPTDVWDGISMNEPDDISAIDPISQNELFNESGLDFINKSPNPIV